MKPFLYLIGLCMVLNIGETVRTSLVEDSAIRVQLTPSGDSLQCQESAPVNTKSFSLAAWGVELRFQYPFFAEPPGSAFSDSGTYRGN